VNLANDSQELLSTESFGTSMSTHRILEVKMLPRVRLFADESGHSWVHLIHHESLWHGNAGSPAADARWGEGDEELSYGDAWEDDPFPGEATAGAASVQLPLSRRASIVHEGTHAHARPCHPAAYSTQLL